MTASFGLRDIFERPFDGEDDPRIRVAQAITRAEAEAILEHRGDLILALSAPSPVEGGGEQKRAKALLRAVERFIREENAHARRARREEIATGQTIQSHDLLTTTRDEVDLAHADLVASFTTEDCRAARRLLSKAPTSPPQATNSEVERTLARRAYVMSEPHLSGHRVVIGFESREHAMDAHEAVARLAQQGEKT